MIDREITIKLAPRPEDGGLRIWSDDLPGLILSMRDQRTVLLALGPAIVALLDHEPLHPLSQFSDEEVRAEYQRRVRQLNGVDEFWHKPFSGRS